MTIPTVLGELAEPLRQMETQHHELLGRTPAEPAAKRTIIIGIAGSLTLFGIQKCRKEGGGAGGSD